jgi:hypothetical protein
MRKYTYFCFALVVGYLFGLSPLVSQPASKYPAVESSPFDFGKLWTFEHAPLDYLEKTYDFRPGQEWLDRTRMSALRFSTYCSASFISPDGLIITNHHCSRGEVGNVMEEGEDFDKNGFYAAEIDKERRAPGLFVKQLVKIQDVTEMVKEYTDKAKTDDDFETQQKNGIKAAVDKYKNTPGWEGLELEPVVYYSGGRYSVYGYKRYDDVRLVLIPELDLGFFGGDADNFTYPRYNLDFTIWRVYEDGKPLNSSNFYFNIQPEGASNGDLVFAVSNPGSTERYRTMAQLEYDRDYRYKIQAAWLNNRMNIFQEKYDKTPSYELQEQIFTFANSVKAFNGILDGLNDPMLMGKKASMENHLKSKSKSAASGQDYWAQLAEAYTPMGPIFAERVLLSPSPLGGSALFVAHTFYDYMKAMENEASKEDLAGLRSRVEQVAAGLNDPFAEKYLSTLLKELKEFADPGDNYIDELLDGRSPEETARFIFQKTDFTNEKKLDKLLDSKPSKLKNSKDPLARMAELLIPQYEAAGQAFAEGRARRAFLEEKVANEVFRIFGMSIPPDATFTLRLADGIVKGYEYNGTEAPYKTTYFGLYDRYYSNDGRFPWSLPERWKNPSTDLLKSPLNFVTTCDSTGGASGSPMVNKEGQLVGILFDGNIESLPCRAISSTIRRLTVRWASISAG